MADSSMEFNAIHGIYRPKIVRYLARFVGEHDAEDLAQDVFVRVARGLPGFRGESRLSTWIYRIARNVAFDRLRGGNSRRMAGTAQSDDRTGDEAPAEAATADTVEQSLIRDEMNACIRKLVDGLPENDRAVLALGDMGELRDREIAERLGVTLGTVKVRTHRARARLRKEMERRCDLYRDGRDELACAEKCPS